MTQIHRVKLIPKPPFDPCVCRNAIRIKVIKKSDENLNRMIIIRAVLSLDPNLIDKLDTVTTTGKNIWFITFNEQYNYRALVGKTVNINGHSVTLENAEEPLKTEKIFTFRIYGLKPHFDKSLIRKHLFDEGVSPSEIIDVYDEFMNDVDFRHVKTGIIRAKLKFDATKNVSYFELVKKIPKNVHIQGEPASIERVGEPRCRYCQGVGHKIAECKIKDQKCVTCKGRGHLASTCNFAKRLVKNNEDFLFDDIDEADDFDDDYMNKGYGKQKNPLNQFEPVYVPVSQLSRGIDNKATNQFVGQPIRQIQDGYSRKITQGPSLPIRTEQTSSAVADNPLNSTEITHPSNELPPVTHSFPRPKTPVEFLMDLSVAENPPHSAKSIHPSTTQPAANPSFSRPKSPVESLKGSTLTTPKPPKAFFYPETTPNRGSKRLNASFANEPKLPNENGRKPKPKANKKNKKNNSKEGNLTEDQIVNEASMLLNLSSVTSKLS